MAAAKGRVCIMFCGMFITGHYPRSPSWVVVLLCLLRPGCGSSTRYCCGSVDTSMSSDKRALDELDALFRDVPAKAVCSSSRPATKLCDGGKASAPSTAAKPRSGAKRKRGGGTGAGGSNNIMIFAPICCDGQLTEETNCTITDNGCRHAKLHKRYCSSRRIGSRVSTRSIK